MTLYWLVALVAMGVAFVAVARAVSDLLAQWWGGRPAPPGLRPTRMAIPGFLRADRCEALLRGTDREEMRSVTQAVEALACQACGVARLFVHEVTLFEADPGAMRCTNAEFSTQAFRWKPSLMHAEVEVEAVILLDARAGEVWFPRPADVVPLEQGTLLLMTAGPENVHVLRSRGTLMAILFQAVPSICVSVLEARRERRRRLAEWQTSLMFGCEPHGASARRATTF